MKPVQGVSSPGDQSLSHRDDQARERGQHGRGARQDLRLLTAMGLDLTFWLLVPVAFLWHYVGHFGRSPDAIAPHLTMVISAWLALAAARLWRWRRAADSKLFSVALCLVLSTFIFAAALYYVTVAIGLRYWNNVISWELAWSYLPHLGSLAEAVGIRMHMVALVLGLGYTCIAVGCWAYLSRWDWARHAAGRLRTRSAVVGGALVCLIAVMQVVGLARGHWALMDEPISMTFRTPPYHFQNHAMGGQLRATNSLADQLARSDYVPGVDVDRRNVVLIVVDGLRPDHLGVLGYQRNTTPFLSELARQRGMRSKGAVKSICAESLCGLLGMAASNYIHAFSEHPLTVHEVLRRHGYQVHMVLSGDHTNFYGLRELYGEVDTYLDGSTQGSYMNDDRLVVETVRDLPPWDGSPVMFQFHLMAPHLLYPRRAEPVFTPAATYGFRSGGATDDGWAQDTSVVNYYDNGVLEADRRIGQILESLERYGYLDDALVVVTGDHGEGLGEHGYFGHGNSVRGPVLWVPLLIFDFGRSSERLPIDAGRIGSVVDIAPTILRELAMPVPSRWIGEALQDPSSGAPLLFQQGPLVGLLDRSLEGGPWKFWVDLNSGENYVFNLHLDPHERCNLKGAVPDGLVRSWKAQLPGPPAGADTAASQGAAVPGYDAIAGFCGHHLAPFVSGRGEPEFGGVEIAPGLP